VSASTYIDTSALAKRYLGEPGSDEFELFTARTPSAAISRLTLVEFRCLLGRRRRSREINIENERRASADFDDDIVGGFLEVHPLDDRHAIGARDILVKVGSVPLRTLDALHLAIAVDIQVTNVATADRNFALAARVLGLHVHWFGEK
jgi:predicted nucleic acid-binding protein